MYFIKETSIMYPINNVFCAFRKELDEISTQENVDISSACSKLKASHNISTRDAEELEFLHFINELRESKVSYTTNLVQEFFKCDDIYSVLSTISSDASI